MKTTYTALMLFISLNITIAQNTLTTYPANMDSNTIKHQNASVLKELKYNNLNSNKSQLLILKDERIDLLEEKIKGEKNIIGFTVQLEVSQQTDIIKNARLKFIKAFPDHPIFDEYIAPNTYLFSGRFYDKNDALAFQHKIKSDFMDTMVIKKSITPPNITE